MPANDAVPVAARFQDTAKTPLQHHVDPQASTDVRASKLVPKSPRLVMTVCMAVLLVLASGGGFLWWNGKKHAGSEMAEPSSPAKDGIATAPLPAVASPPPMPQQETESAVAPQSAQGSATPVQAQQVTPVAEPAQVAPAAPSRKEIQVSATALHAATKPAPAIAHSAAPATLAPVPDAMARKVTTLLAKADGYIGSHQYDKAIATAESALELEPGSTAATAMVNKAKARQLEALKNGSSLD
jgi:cytoskeletal protein RodZ